MHINSKHTFSPLKSFIITPFLVVVFRFVSFFSCFESNFFCQNFNSQILWKTRKEIDFLFFYLLIPISINQQNKITPGCRANCKCATQVCSASCVQLGANHGAGRHGRQRSRHVRRCQHRWPRAQAKKGVMTIFDCLISFRLIPRTAFFFIQTEKWTIPEERV